MPARLSSEHKAEAAADAALFREVGEAIAGERYQTPISRLLEIGDRRVREFVLEERRVPAWVWPELRAGLRARIKALQDLLERMPE